MKKRQTVMRKEVGERSSRNPVAGTVRYMECQKNHAASVGGYAVDGCMEFMPGGAQGTPAARTCAACGCHRSFHRRAEEEPEVVGDNTSMSSSS